MFNGVALKKADLFATAANPIPPFKKFKRSSSPVANLLDWLGSLKFQLVYPSDPDPYGSESSDTY